MLIKIGTVNKEINSTKLPVLETEIDVELKAPCSMVSPVIRLHDDVYHKSYNYVIIPDFNRAYFINSAVITPGKIWELGLAVDVLASFSAYIRNATAYVARSANIYNNRLVDSTWTHTTDVVTSNSEITLPDVTGAGCFLLSVCNRADATATHVNAIPAVSTYVMSAQKLHEVCSYMFSPDFLDLVSQGADESLKTISSMFFNPFQYVTKCTWFPIAINGLSTVSDTMSFGFYETEVTANRLTTHFKTIEFSFQLGSYETWTDRNGAWTHNTLYIPGFGQMDISTDYEGEVIRGKINVDLASGEAGLFLTLQDGTLVASATGKWGCDIQLSSLYEDFVSDLGSKSGLIKAGIGAVSGVAKQAKELFTSVGASYAMSYGQDVSEVDLSAVNAGQLARDAVNGATQALQPTMSTIGANGTRAVIELNLNAILSITKHTRFEDMHTRLGGMCNRVLLLANCSGYTEVVNPHVNCPATSAEISMINNFLSGGFYLE